jgi:hypothetical protein
MKTGNVTSRKTSLTSRNAGNRGVSNTGHNPTGSSHSSSPASGNRTERSEASGGGRGSSARSRKDVKRAPERGSR